MHKANLIPMLTTGTIVPGLLTRSAAVLSGARQARFGAWPMVKRLAAQDRLNRAVDADSVPLPVARHPEGHGHAGWAARDGQESAPTTRPRATPIE